MRAISIAVAALLLCNGALAAKLTVDHGNIARDGKRLTNSGHDSEPLASPDGHIVVFLRATGKPAVQDCSATGDQAKPVELWSVNSDGSNARPLLQIHGGTDIRTVVCDFTDKQFNSTGTLLYFATPAWATSGAIHVLDMRSGREHLFVDGDGLHVLAACRDPKYRDDIVISQHRYFVFSGSFDWSWLYTPAAREVGPLGDGDIAAAIADACN
jgi:hypothetical protein